MKKWISLLLVGLLIFNCAACTKEAGSEDDSGGTDIQKQETDSDKKVVSDNDEEGEFVAKELQIPENADIVDFVCYLEDGTLRIGTSDIDLKTNKIWDSDDNGQNWREVTDEGAMDETALMNGGYACSSGGELYIYDMNNVYIPQNSDEKSFQTINIQKSEMDIYLDSAFEGSILTVLVGVEGGKNKIRQYNLETGESIEIENEELAKRIDKRSGFGTLAADKTGEILYIEDGGISRYNTKTEEYSTLLDSSILNNYLYALDNPIAGITVNEKEDKIVVKARRMQNRTEEDTQMDGLYCFSKEKTSETGDSTELVVYSLTENSFIRQLIPLFRKTNPEIVLTYQVGYTGEDGVTKSDAIRSLNTEIMAGEGPDILVLDGLPWEQYADKGILEEVSDLTKTDKDNLFYNLVEACNTDGKIYAVPGTFAVPMVLGSKKIVEAGNTAALIKQLEAAASSDIPALYKNDFPIAAVALFVTSDIAKDGITQDELSGYYKDLKKLSKLCNLEISKEESSTVYSLAELAARFPYVGTTIGLDVYLDRAKAGIKMEISGDGYVELVSAMKEKQLSLGLLNQDGGNYFAPSEIIGMSSMTNQKEAAGEFLKFYLTEEAQDLNNMGFSINRNRMEKEMPVSENAEFYSALYDTMDSIEGLTINTLTTEECQEFISQVESLDTPVQTDAVILETVMEQADKYLYEGEELDAAVRAAYDKVTLYLKE